MKTTQHDHEAQRFEAWCIVELLGHKTLAGLVSETMIANTWFFSIQIPHITGNRTELFAPGAVYRIRPCTEETARAVSTSEHGCIDLLDMRCVITKNDGLIERLKKLDEYEKEQPLLVNGDDGSEENSYE